MILSSIFSQIDTIYQGHETTIRFVEGTVDSIKTNSGLEIRLKACSPVVIGIYPSNRHHGEWGEFKHFITGEEAVDRHWYILTNNLTDAAGWWERSNLTPLLTNYRDYLEQIQINHDEMIARLRRFHSPEKVVAFLEQLCVSTG